MLTAAAIAAIIAGGGLVGTGVYKQNQINRERAPEGVQQRYETGSEGAPSNAQLKQWGLSRDQYKSLYNQAAKDFKTSGIKVKSIGAGKEINEVNKFLKDKMVATNGAYGRHYLGLETKTNSVDRAPTQSQASAAGGGGGGGVGVGGGSTALTPRQFYTADQLAKQLGMTLDYEKILKDYQGATTAKFDELDTERVRAESTQLRAQESAYNNYLMDIRNQAANAVASGATKGTMSANSLLSMLGMQEANRESANTYNQLAYDIAQQRGTALATDQREAREKELALRQYLGQLAVGYDTNDVALRAAELAANAQTRAAGITASGQIQAARAQQQQGTDRVWEALVQTQLNQNPYMTRAGAERAASPAYVDLYRSMR